MATPPKKPTDGTKPPAPRKPATPRKPSTRKPAPRKTAAATPAKPAARKTAPAAAKPSVKPAAKPTVAAKPAARRAAAADKTTSATGKKWGLAAVIGGVGAAVTAGLLALRGSTPVDAPTPNEDKKAHQADGTDSSQSFAAGIADEGTIPE